MSDQLALLPGYLTAHLQLALLALLLGVAISMPAGVMITRWRWLDQPVLGVASVIQTIPSLALLALMVPTLAAVGLQSFGFLPAFIGLVLYSLLPVLRNTVVGLTSVDPALIEAARAVGMTPGQRLWRVELPLALPIIVAGVRTATVLTVGVATLSTPVGAPSLGNYIFSGLQTRNFTAVLVGCVAAALLALALDGLLWALGAALVGRRKRVATTVIAVVVVLYAYTGWSLVSDVRTQQSRIVVGAKAFTEQYILSEILSGQLATETDATVSIVSSLGSTVAFDALRTGEIDVYVDYSGTIYATIMGRDTTPDARERILVEVRDYLRDRHGIVVAGTLGFENAYALAIRQQDASRLSISTIGQLTAHAPAMTIGGDYEFFARAEWAALQSQYGLRFSGRRTMEPALMYEAVARGFVDVISAFSTDGRVAAFDLYLLDDERGAIPPYDALILVGSRLAREQPEVIAALRRLSGTIDAELMRQMNLAVDLDGQSPADVGGAFLRTLAGSPP